MNVEHCDENHPATVIGTCDRKKEDVGVAGDWLRSVGRCRCSVVQLLARCDFRWANGYDHSERQMMATIPDSPVHFWSLSLSNSCRLARDPPTYTSC
ncbi:hypothetical protein E3N88_16337 [Mikania micrantha]|uniref:Uncharacterized protein n=1 Tax=Mikania micrantha TaxID=192012 RepID=A0A5N6NZD4_9ASTR|nr:hypothetical protein E3N88_16337 [Mikania micrantha]